MHHRETAKLYIGFLAVSLRVKRSKLSQIGRELLHFGAFKRHFEPPERPVLLPTPTNSHTPDPMRSVAFVASSGYVMIGVGSMARDHFFGDRGAFDAATLDALAPADTPQIEVADMVDSGSLSQPVSLPHGHVPVPMIMVGKIKTPTEKDPKGKLKWRGPVGSPIRPISSPSESVAAPPPALGRLVAGLKHGAGAAGSGDQLPESASSTIGGAHQPRLWSPAAVWMRPAVVTQQDMMPSTTPRCFTRLDSAARTATCQRVLIAVSPGSPHSSMCHWGRLTSLGAAQPSTRSRSRR